MHNDAQPDTSLSPLRKRPGLGPWRPSREAALDASDRAARSHLPPALVLGEAAAAALHSFLVAHDLGDWPCFSAFGLDLDPLERVGDHLAALGEGDAAWEPIVSFTPGGVHPADWCPPAGGRPERLDPPGVLWLRRPEVVVLRYYRHTHDGHWVAEHLYAAPSASVFRGLLRRLAELGRAGALSRWQVLRGPRAEPGMPREAGGGWDVLTLPPSLRERLQTEVLGFFDARAAALYRGLGIPYRRGVLLHGPPGNGKTSLVRAMGAMLAGVAAMLLRPAASFDADDFAWAVRQWAKAAPALLVIEDLDWLLSKLDLSTFLNEVDGVEPRGGGLLLVATTNHPDALDPAVNNRPGRFDVVVEVPPPTEPLRRAFLAGTAAGEVGPGAVAELAAGAEGLSYAHLREVVSLSGLAAVRDGRAGRTAEDLRRALAMVCAGHREARRGFPGRRQPAGFGAGDED